jgi:hypothetical protein
VLKLGTWLEAIVTSRHRRHLPDSVPAAECRQRRIRQLRPACH